MCSDSKTNWWEETLFGAEKDLRDLLWNIAKNLGQKGILGHFPWKKNENYKPFKNIFLEKKNKKKYLLQQFFGIF